MSDRNIAYARIHPGVGVARVGPSQAYFIGPEVPRSYPIDPDTGEPLSSDAYRDAEGRIKRQGARFRIYGYNAAGEVVCELNHSNAHISWSVHLANKKAAWYEFNVAMDIPEAVPCARRNASFHGKERERLVIDPGAVDISGANNHVEIPAVAFLGSEDCNVALGTLLTDAAGRLIVLGGYGKSGTPIPNNDPIVVDNNYANTGRVWFDDIADGPVDAKVQLHDGREVEVEPAWVITGPPDYAPGIIPIVTALDVVNDLFEDPHFGLGVWRPVPTTPSFTEDIFPILARMCATEWVNYGFFVKYGWQAPMRFLEPSLLARLASREPATQELRIQLFDQFRNPSSEQMEALGWPPIYGDAVALPANSPRNWLALTKQQYAILQQWSVGNFTDDWQGIPEPASLDSAPLQQQPQLLDEGPLFYCMGGPFHPGGALPYLIRIVTMWSSPFRVRRRGADQPERDYGDVLHVQEALGTTGPMYENGPGDLTRWQAIPWQVDVSGCGDGYNRSYDAFLPTFWPAFVPNQILTQAGYEVVMDPRKSMQARQEAFQHRRDWLMGLPNRRQQALAKEMITEFATRSIVAPRPGPGAPFPEQLWVADLGGQSKEDYYRQLVARIYQAFLEGDLDAFFANLSTNVEFRIFGPQGAPTTGTYRGHDGVRAWLQNDGRTISTLQLQPPAASAYVVDGSRVAVIGKETGVMAAASGVAYSGEWSHLWEFEGDLVSRFSEYLMVYQDGETGVEWS